ncbi:MAG: glycosyl hydrolase family 28 protein [Candidatus Azobacteroides sp.]|nr:glycosyl hydrolase family 28 protein [Candidatus Azobacteroides sp.]
MKIIHKYILCIVFLITGFQVRSKDYSITEFGVKSDGLTCYTTSIQRAIDAIHEQGGGCLVFSAGRYVTGSIYLKSNVTIHFEEGAVLYGSTNPLDYVKDAYVGWHSLIFAVKQENIGITGPGIIDGRGFITANNLMSLIHYGIIQDPLELDRPNESNRPENIHFVECNNIVITDITLRNPAGWNQTYDRCKNLHIGNIRVEANAYWNNDGIDIVDCDGVVIKNSWFDAADDAICFKSHSPDQVCQNVVVDNCVGRSSANGLKFGTASYGGFKNIKVTNLTIYDTYRSAVTIASVDGAEIENIEVDGVKAINTGNVFYLRIASRSNSGRAPYMKNIRISDVYAEVPPYKPDEGYNYEGPIQDQPRNILPASISGMPGTPIQDVTLKNITIVYPGGGDPFYAYRGTTPAELDSIPELLTGYPEFSRWKELPAWGVYLRHVEGIIFDNVVLTAWKPDYRPAIVMDDVHTGDFRKTIINEPNNAGKEQIITYKSINILK